LDEKSATNKFSTATISIVHKENNCYKYQLIHMQYRVSTIW